MTARELNAAPLISVIVPIYMVEDYLRECVESVLSQPCDDYEIILVDDGSLDGCPAICDEYAERYDRVNVIHKENGGLSDARNAGILRAEGEYLLFLDSDDMLVENSLPEIEKAIRDGHPDVLIGNFALFPDTKAEETDFWDPCLMTSRDSARVKEYLFANNSRFWWTAWRNIVKRSFLLEHEIFFMKGILHEDEEWTPRLYWLAETYYYADAPFYCYRKRAGSITSMVKYSNVKSICLVADSLERFMGRHPDSRVYVRMRQRSVARAINVQTQFLTNAEIGDLLKEFDNTPVIDMIRRSFYFTFLSSVLSTKNHLVFEKYLRKVRNTVKRWLPRRLELKLRSLRAFIRRYMFLKTSVQAGR